MRNIKRNIVIAFVVIALITSLGCSSEGKKEVVEKEGNNKLWKGYGHENTTPKPVKFKKIH